MLVSCIPFKHFKHVVYKRLKDVDSMYLHCSHIMSVMLIHPIKKYEQINQDQNVQICAGFLV